MRLIILLALCASISVKGNDDNKAAESEEKFLPYALAQGKPSDTRYTLLSESKDYEDTPATMTTTIKPWRRLSYIYGNQQPVWPSSVGLIGPLLGLPALLMIGINLGGLLYSLLALLGLTQHRFGNSADLFRNDRQHLLGGVDKQASLYFKK